MHRIILLIIALLFSLSTIASDTSEREGKALKDSAVSTMASSNASGDSLTSESNHAKKESKTVAQPEPKVGPYNSKLWWFMIGAMSLWVLFDMWRRRQ